MKDRDEDRGRSQGSQKREPDGEFSHAMSRLENAVQELVTVAKGEISERATSVIDETSKRLEMELKLKRASENNPEADEEHSRRHRSHRSRHRFADYFEGQYSPLYIDKNDEKVAGVCAAFARHLGVENWVIRMGALTGLIFIPTIVFPGYWIAYFVLEKRNKKTKTSKRSRRGRRGRHERSSNIDETQEMEAEQATSKPSKKRSGGRAERVPTRDLRHVMTDLTQSELRLRRMESFVTSNQYELHKELNKIDREGAK